MDIKATAARMTSGLLQPPQPLKGTWTRLPAPPLPRSSHSISVVAGRAYIFGGEVRPREPVDNDVHIVTLPSGTVTSADYKSIPATAQSAGGPVPEKRIGHSAAVIGERIFMFGGRGGKDMKSLEEKGRVWIFDTRSDKWTFLDPVEGTQYPAARSYHCSVGIEKPEPASRKPLETDQALEEPKIGTIAEGAKTDGAGAGHGTFFVHAGCLAEGRTNDLWGFDVMSRTWKKYPDAPGPPRGGTALTVSKHRIYRYGGFDGKTEIGGKLDTLHLGLETFNDKSGSGELGVHAKGPWNTLDFTEEDMLHPGTRSVAGLHSITTGMGHEYLILLLGEGNPSDQGHDGAGKFFGDVWAFQAPPQGMTAASLKAAALQALGKETGEGLWSEVGIAGEKPSGRGWFASSQLGDVDVSGIVLWGGLNDKNVREDDGWIFTVA